MKKALKGLFLTTCCQKIECTGVSVRVSGKERLDPET